MHQPVKQLSTLILTLAVMSSGHAAERQSLQSLQQAAIEFVTEEHPPGSDLEVVPDRLDPRLRLTQCESPLQAFWAPGSASVGGTTVGIRCDGARPWKLYLPTRVKLMQPVVVAARPLARGQQLGSTDLRLEQRDVGRLSTSAVLDPETVVGYVVKRGVPAGRALDLKILEPPRLVERGRRVRMFVVAEGINITMNGLALEDGALGKTVRVRNPASKRVVEGVVTGPARVRLAGSARAQKTSNSQ